MMKTFTRTFLGAFAIFFCWQNSLQAQAVRHDVILEVATGTWCQYCPGAAMGADELAAAGAAVGIVEHHNGDAYTTASSDGRNSYYAVSGFPTAWFDGANALVGGSHTVSLYPSYQQRYNAAKIVATPFELSGSWVQNGANVDITVNVDQVGAYSGSNLRLQAALTESNIMVNWQGLSQCDFVNRAMYPDHNGTAITTTQGGPTVTQTFSMAIDPSWVQQEMQLVIWIENSVTKEIFNGRMITLSTAAHAVDVAAIEIGNTVASQSCITSIAPEVVIRNMGANDLTAATITYDMNGGTPVVFNWTGTVPYFAYSNITLPAISFAPQATNTLTVTIAVPSDSSFGNDVVTKTWAEASLNNAGTYMVRIKPDNYGSEISWDIKNSAGTVIGSGGPYTDGNRIQINVPVAIGTNDCFTFSMYDSFGDGIGVNPGAGWFRLEGPLGDTIYAGADYGSIDFVDFRTDSTTIIIANAPRIEEEVSVYPNPSNGLFEVRLGNAHPNGALLTVWNANGQKVWESNIGSQMTSVDLTKMASGMYLLRVLTETGSTTKRIQKN